MDKKVDTEQLIATIKQHEIIWNKNAKDYYSKTRKDVAWNKVCAELLQGWNKLDKREKLLKRDELKKRWNNIRDYYKKDLTQQINARRQATMKKNRYIYSEQLEFLTPLFSQCAKEEKTASDDEPKEIYIDEDYSTDSEATQLIKRKMFLESNSSEESKSEELYPTAATTSKIEEDCDLLFLHSLLPDMKMMNQLQKIDFKMDILKLCKHTLENNGDAC